MQHTTAVCPRDSECRRRRSAGGYWYAHDDSLDRAHLIDARSSRPQPIRDRVSRPGRRRGCQRSLPRDCLAAGARARRLGRRQLRLRGAVHRHLLPAKLPEPPAGPQPSRLLLLSGGGHPRWLSRVPALPPQRRRDRDARRRCRHRCRGHTSLRAARSRAHRPCLSQRRHGPEPSRDSQRLSPHPRHHAGPLRSRTAHRRLPPPAHH